MQYMQFTAARADTGAVLPLGKATVYLTGTGTKATLYDHSGTVISNPVTASTAGLVSFAAADGIYDIVVTSADNLYSTPTMIGVQIYDLSVLAAGVALIPSKADLASPTLTGTPLAPTATTGTNNTQIATTAYVTAKINALINGADAAHDTFLELQTLMSSDETTAASLAITVGGKLTASSNLSDLTNPATARQNLALRPGVEVQAFSSILGALTTGAVWSAGVQVPTFTAAGTVIMKTVGTGAGNLLDKSAGDALYASIGTVGTGLTNGDKGDITVSGTGSVTWTIDNNAVSFAKFQAAAGNGLVGANTTGNYQHITIGTGLLLSGGVLSGAGLTTEDVRDTIGATLTAGSGLYTVVDDTGDIVRVAREDRAPVVSEPFYLPQLPSGAVYHSVVSLERLIPTYVGALVNVGSDLGAGATGVTASAIAQLRAGGTELRIATLYDQTGNSRNGTQATSGHKPGLHEAILCRGKPMMLFDGKRADIGNPHPVGLDFTLSLNSRSNTRIMLIDPTDSIVPQTFEHCDSGVGKNLYTYTPPSPPYTPDQNGNIEYGDGSAAVSSGMKAPCSPFVLAVRDRSGGQDVFVNGAKFSTSTVPAAGTLSVFRWGYSSGAGLDSFWPNMRTMAYITISGDTTDNEVLQITRCLQHRWGIAANKPPRVAVQGDSISEGVAAVLTQNGPLWWRDDIGQTVEVYNWGIAGKFLQQCYSDRVVTDGSIYVSDRTCVYIIQAGINDIHAGGSTGSTLYSTYLAPYVSYLHGLGANAKVIVCTLLPQTAHVTTSIESERNNYNALVRANTAGADIILDIAADPRMGLYTATPNNTLLMPDNIHPSSLGYSYLGPVYAAAVRAALAL